MGCIYLVTNKINGKQYVGQSKTTMFPRKISHESGHGGAKSLWKAICKYGKENFEWEEVYSNVANEDLNRLEIECIDWYDSKNKGYNQSFGGEAPFRGLYHTEESKRKTSEKLKGRKASLQERLNKSKPKSLEHCRNISKGRKGIPMSLEQRENLRILKTGSKLSEETKRKIQKSLMGRACKSETRRKLSLANMGKKRTPEQIELYRQVQLKPEIQLKRIASYKKTIENYSQEKIRTRSENISKSLLKMYAERKECMNEPSILTY